MFLEKITILENPAIIFFVSIFVILFNTVLSAHFIPIIFAGIEFIIFIKCLRKKYNYSLILTIFTFLFIEINSGLSPFSLSLLSYFLYTIVIPYIKNIFSSTNFKHYLYIFIFYSMFFILTAIFSDLSYDFFLIIILNIVIDFMLIGIFL